MIAKVNGRAFLNLASLTTATVLSSGLYAEEINPTSIAGRCNYGDCAIFHECTAHHDSENLKELNSTGIVTQAILTPIDIPCHAYGCFSLEHRSKVSDASCDRSKKLAALVLASRDIVSP